MEKFGSFERRIKIMNLWRSRLADACRQLNLAQFAPAALALSLNIPATTASAEPVAVAIAKFDYIDTSGEVRDQRQEHAARLAAFSQTLRAKLGEDASYALVDLDCANDECSLGNGAPQALIQRARLAHAKLLVYGGVHKMSTLVQWEQLNIIDVGSGKRVLNRLLTFRGDTDDAWRHAALYTANLILDAKPTP